jgi:hypothetical protein
VSINKTYLGKPGDFLALVFCSGLSLRIRVWQRRKIS